MKALTMNEDLYETLWSDLTVCVKQPVRLLDEFTSADELGEEPEIGEPAETTTETTEETTEEETTEGETEEQTEPEEEPESITAESAPEYVGEQKYVGITMLTPKEGLPTDNISISGLRDDKLEAPFIERTERSDRINKLGASVFGDRRGIIIAIGVAVIAAAAISAIVITKLRPKKKTPDGSTRWR